MNGYDAYPWGWEGENGCPGGAFYGRFPFTPLQWKLFRHVQYWRCFSRVRLRRRSLWVDQGQNFVSRLAWDPFNIPSGGEEGGLRGRSRHHCCLRDTTLKEQIDKLKIWFKLKLYLLISNSGYLMTDAKIAPSVKSSHCDNESDPAVMSDI